MRLLIAGIVICVAVAVVMAMRGGGSVASKVSQTDERQQVQWLKQNAVPIRSLDPADEDFSDLEPLRKSIGVARVVFLGEQTHADGSVFLAKTRLIKYLHREMGFDVLAFEGGFYDCRKAWSLLPSGLSPYQLLSHAVLPVWRNSEQCQPLADYLATAATSDRPLELAGFDCQLTGFSSVNYLEADIQGVLSEMDSIVSRSELQSTLTEIIRAQVRNDPLPLAEVQERRRQALAEFSKALADAEPTDNLPAAELAFWRQMGGSLAGGAEFSWALPRVMQGDKQAAGIRDGQMAKNLVWLAQTAYPDRKLIVWAASAHLARNIESVRPQSNFIPSNFYQGSVTMGHDAAKVIGDNLYSIMFSAAEGEVSMPWTPAEQVPAVSAGSIENMLIDAGHRNAFMDLHSTAIGADWLRNVQTARPFGFIEMSADWSRVCDAFFLTRKATRSTLASRAEQ